MNAIDTVKKAYAAWEKKDLEALRGLLHNDYKATMPGGMEIVGIEGAKQCLDACTSEGRGENETFIVDGDRVVRIWDHVVTSPRQYRVRMAELNIVKDGKVIFNEAFFDSGAFPKEDQEEFAQMKEKFGQKTPVAGGKSSS